MHYAIPRGASFIVCFSALYLFLACGEYDRTTRTISGPDTTAQSDTPPRGTDAIPTEVEVDEPVALCPADGLPFRSCTSKDQCKERNAALPWCYALDGCCVECLTNTHCPTGFECDSDFECVLEL